MKAVGRSSRSLRTPFLCPERRSQLLDFQERAGFSLSDLSILDLAFCHRSYVNESSIQLDNNERLEFLGDSVLGMVVADYLYSILPDRREGELARIKSYVVSEDNLAILAKELGLDSLVYLGKGEDSSGGRNKKSVLSDCMEAVIGALFLNAGFQQARHFVLSRLKNSIEEVIAERHRFDYKSRLQILVQKHYHSKPKYRLDKREGPDHDLRYWVSVVVEDKAYGPGKGKNKKSAEQNAAKEAYEAFAVALDGPVGIVKELTCNS